ncbi:hypothetical protein BJY04DRAFT_223091 [Aspergillus karnatakaensis]|uniref:alpha-ketoglutarate-dependent dioxygenase AlkB family protein n=1 Tax=Aspergillus karnatakaensis TaxID=1810916 RepID=UPI003CCE3A34
MSKRTLESFYKAVTPPQSKRPKPDPSPSPNPSSLTYTNHPSYPHPIANLPPSIAEPLANIAKDASVNAKAKRINDQPHLDLLYFHPLIPSPTARELFEFLRRELPFYRVQYEIKRFGKETKINTPRFTTVFGVDETSVFVPSPKPDHDLTKPKTESTVATGANHKDSDGDNNTDNININIKPEDPDPNTVADTPFPEITESTLSLTDTQTRKPTPAGKYKATPRPIPPALDALRKAVQASIGDSSTYNFCLVNYYATGDDSISYHSDDERFLGANPSIASISLGAQRDFLMRHKPSEDPGVSNQPMKFQLAGGDMVVMRGETQANWLHSIPKRKGGEASRGRINITFRRAVVRGGTENYYTYNVGAGGVYRWDEGRGRMCLVEGDG